MTQQPNPFIPQSRPVKLAHVAIVLDRSGSMESCRDETITGFNHYTQDIRQTAMQAGLDARLTLTVFNNEIRMPLFQASLDRLHPLSRKHYVPNGSTSMLDAVGQTIDRLEREGSRIHEASVLVCIISDGMENSSTEYSYEAIAARITRLTATERWTFTYLGANQDLSTVAENLNIPKANMAAYASTGEGTADAWERHTRSSRRRMEDMSAGKTSSRDFYADQQQDGE